MREGEASGLRNLASLSGDGGRDALTGLLNRQQFLDMAGRQLNEGALGLVIVWFNLDGFKLYNRRFGFDKGNTLLRDIAYQLTMVFQNGIVSRFSDDNFIVLTGWERLEDNIERVQKNLLRTHREAVMKLRAGVCFPSARDAGRSAGLVCDRAKMACDSIRRDHSVNVKIYQEGLTDDLNLTMRIVDSLDDALENGDILVMFQPVVRVMTRSLCSMEALTRWEDKRDGVISPAGFVPVLEEYRDIQKLDMGVVRRICSMFSDRMKKGLPVLPASVNLSRLDFELCDVFAEVNSVVEESGIPKNLLKIEITESFKGADQNVLRLGIEKFRDAGFEVWMDDFGSGYSSLNVLKSYNFDAIKFDMKFLSDFEHSTGNGKCIITSNLSMTKQMGVQSLAEGVETEEQFDFIRSIGFEKAQGFLFGRAMPLEDVFALPMPIEDWRDAPYYDSLSRTEVPNQDTMNRVGGRALADVRALTVVEWYEPSSPDGGRFKVIYGNDVVKSWYGAKESAGVNALFNHPDSKTRKRFIATMLGLRTPGETGMFYAFLLGRCIQITIIYLAVNPRNGTRAYLLSIARMTRLPDGSNVGPIHDYLRKTLGTVEDLGDAI